MSMWPAESGRIIAIKLAHVLFVILTFAVCLPGLVRCSAVRTIASQRTDSPTHTFYVATNGSDLDEGTASRPWSSIQHAAEMVTPGTTVHVAPGLYLGPVQSTVSGQLNARIRFVSDEKWGARIIGPGHDAVWLNSGHFVDIERFDITGQGYIGIQNEGSFVRVVGNHVHDMQGQCNSTGGAGIVNSNYQGSDNDVVANLVERIDAPPGCPKNFQRLIHGIYHSNLRGHIWNNITHGNGGCGIHLWHAANQVVIANNLTFSNRFGICVGAGDAPGGVVNDNTQVTNNIVVNNSEVGIVESGANGRDNAYVDNLTYANGAADFKLDATEVAIGTITVAPASVFVNWNPAGGGDYHLKPNSPARGRGNAKGMPMDDYEGASRSQQSPDIGPFAAH